MTVTLSESSSNCCLTGASHSNVKKNTPVCVSTSPLKWAEIAYELKRDSEVGCTHGQLWVKEPKTAVAFQSIEVVCGWFRKVSKWVSMPNRRKLCHDRLWIHILGGKAVLSPSCCIYVRSVSLGCLRHPSFDRWVRRTRRKLEYRYTFFRSKWEEFIFVVNEGKCCPVWRPVFLGQATHEDRFLPHTTQLKVNILLFLVLL